MMRVFFATFAAAVILSPIPTAAAQSLDACKKMATDTERLACFDKLQRPAPKVRSPADPVLAKAHAAVARKLKDPESAKFSDLKRAFRRNGRGERVDSVCGFVNAKNSYGGYPGATPFVYLPAADEAFISGGDITRDAIAFISTTAYRNICIEGN